MLDLWGLLALGWGEVAVARAEGEAVGFADGVDADDVDGDVEVFNHAADDGELLVVFFAEDGGGGLDDVEEFEDNKTDTVEVAGAAGATEVGGEVGFDDVDGAVGEVDFVWFGCENHIDANVGAEGEVGVELAGVFGEVFFGAELGGVDKDADGDASVCAGEFFCFAHESEVAFVEGAHSRHKDEWGVERLLLPVTDGLDGVEQSRRWESGHFDGEVTLKC